jgi:hypothetical protein
MLWIRPSSPPAVVLPLSLPPIPRTHTHTHTHNRNHKRVLREDLFLPLLLAALLLLGAHAFATDARRMIVSPLVRDGVALVRGRMDGCMP